MFKKYDVNCIIILLSAITIASGDQKIIVHPYRQFETATTNENGVTFYNSKIYIGTLFDGHIYEYDYQSLPEYFIDKYQLRIQDINANSAGSMICDGIHLYAATSYSFSRLPKIYIFNLNENGCPEESLNLFSVDPVLYLFFNPSEYNGYIYWGCYHTGSGINGQARIIKFNKSDRSITLKKSAQLANYTYTTAILGNNLFASTETGKILRFKIDRAGNLSEYACIDLSSYGVTHIQHLKADANTNILWVNTTIQNSLFCIVNPAGTLISPVIYHTSNNIVNGRVYLGCDNYLYGQDANSHGYKIKHRGSGSFDFCAVPNLDYNSFGAILGGYYDSQTQKHFLVGENFRIKDTNLQKREMRVLNLNDNTLSDKIFDDIESTNTGAILVSLDSDTQNKLYASTYWIGFMYSINANDLTKELLKNNGIRINKQADVIKAYPAGDVGDMLFGLYGGSTESATLLFYDSNPLADPHWKYFVLPQPNPSMYYSRILSFADDNNNDIYLGTGALTLNQNTPPAAIFKIEKESLKQNPPPSDPFYSVPFTWPQPGDDIPYGIMSMVYYDGYLYCVSYHFINGIVGNRFFRICISDGSVLKSSESASFTGHKSKILYKDGASLLVGFGAKLFKYNLTNFNIDQPEKTLYLGSEMIAAIVGDNQYYYVCQPGRICIYTHGFVMVRQITNPIPGDEFYSMSLHNSDGYLYVITHNGILYKYEIPGINTFDEIVFWNTTNKKFYVEISDGTKFDSGTEDLWMDNDNFIGTSYIYRTGDFNGDGSDDIVSWPNYYLSSENHLRVALSDPCGYENRQGFEYVGRWKEAWGYQGDIINSGDFDGDGYDDMMRCHLNSRSDYSLYVTKSDGSKFNSEVLWFSGSLAFTCMKTGDFNGDGRCDILFHNYNSTETAVYLSTGNNFDYAGCWLTNWGHPDYVWGSGDFDGDGDYDLLHYSPNEINEYGTTGIIRVFLSNNSNFVYQGRWYQGYGNPNYQIKIGDYNGDTKDDFLLWNPYGGYTVWVFLKDPINEAFIYSGSWLTGQYDNIYSLDVGNFDAFTNPINLNKDIKNEISLKNKKASIIKFGPISPNIFTSSLMIKYQLSEPCIVNVSIYNSIGQRVAVLVDNWQKQNNYNIMVNTNKWHKCGQVVF
jgi:hypothetical protein